MERLASHFDGVDSARVWSHVAVPLSCYFSKHEKPLQKESALGEKREVDHIAPCGAANYDSTCVWHLTHLMAANFVNLAYANG